MNGLLRTWVKLDQPHLKSKEYDDQVRNSPTSALAGPNDNFQIATPKSSFGKVYP